MTNTNHATSEGMTASITSRELEDFKKDIKGEVIDSKSPKYDETRKLWNATIDKRPGLIVKCQNEQDIVESVNFAREHDLILAIRAGGHNIAGLGSCDDGIVIDISELRSVKIDKSAKTAKVAAGALLSDVDSASQEHSLAVPLGINSTTGVAGLTLGGGFGWLTRKYGMTVDNLRSARIITADGKIITTNKSSQPDLFWAIKGGGGNFGVVSEFTFDLHQVGPEIYSGFVVYPLDVAKKVLEQFSAYASELSDDASAWVVMRQAPPLPFIPEPWHGKAVVVFALAHCGELSQAEKEFEPIRQFDKPIGEHLGANPYAEWQKILDPLLAPGLRNYWKSHNFKELSVNAWETAIKFMNDLPSPHCELFFAQLGGAVNRVPADATAYSHRDIEFIMNVHARWEDAKDDDTCISWARDLHKAMDNFSSGGAYSNFMTADEAGIAKSAYADAFKRLRKVKKQYDPLNLFRVNHNIEPE